MDGAPPASAGLGRGAIPFARQPGAGCCFLSTGGLPNAARWSGANPGPSHAFRTPRASRGLKLPSGSLTRDLSAKDWSSFRPDTVSRSRGSTEMPGAALRGARGTCGFIEGGRPPLRRPARRSRFRTHPPAARRPISALTAPLLAYRSIDMRASLARWRGDQDGPYGSLAVALTSGADPATSGRSSGAGH